MKIAAENGQLPVLQWVYERFPQVFSNNSLLIIHAVVQRKYDIKILEWISERYPCDYDRLCSLAVNFGHLEVLQWVLLQKKFVWNTMHFGWMGQFDGIEREHEYIEIMNCLLHNGCISSGNSFSYMATDALTYGLLELVYWLEESLNAQIVLSSSKFVLSWSIQSMKWQKKRFNINYDEVTQLALKWGKFRLYRYNIHKQYLS